MMTRGSRLAGLAVAAWLLSASAEVSAQPVGPSVILIAVDEFADGTIVGFNGLAVLPAAFLADPGPGGLPSALTYNLLNPPGLVAGDVIINETPGSPISDLVRFNPNQNGGSLVFYSDITDGKDAPADVGFPTLNYTNTITLTESGTETGLSAVSYTPTAGQPGFVAGAAVPVNYVIVSDPVPEPGPLALGGIALLMGAAFAWTRRARAATSA